MAGTSFLDRTIDEAFGALDHYKDVAEVSMQGTGMGSTHPILSGSLELTSEILSGTKLHKHTEQLEHFRGWCYVTVNRIATRVAGQPPKMGRRLVLPIDNEERRPRLLRAWDRMRAPAYVKDAQEDVELLEAHPLLEALRDPNPAMVDWQLFYSTVASLELTGRAFWWVSVEDGKHIIWPFPSDWVTPKHTGGKLFTEYHVKSPNSVGDPFRVPPEEIMFFSLPDPADPMKTISPLQSQAAAITTDEAIQTAQYRTFTNGIFPGVMIQVGRMPGMLPGQPGERPVLEPEQRKELIAAARQIYEGAVNYHEPLILDGLIESVERLTNTAREMDFLQSGASVKNRIFQAFGINPIIAGEVVNVNRAQAAVAEESFATNCVNPLLVMMGQVVTRWLHQNGEPDMVFWIEPTRANDPELRLKEWTTALNSPKNVVTADEYRQHVLGLPPAESEEETEGEAGGEALAKSEATVTTSRFRRLVTGLWLRQYEEQERDMARAMGQFFHDQQKAVVREFGRVVDEQSQAFAAPKAAEQVVAMIFRPRDWDEKLREAATGPLTLAISKGYLAEKALFESRHERTADGLRLKQEFGFQLDVELPASVRARINGELAEQMSQPYWDGINDTSRANMERTIRTGIKEELSVQQIAKNLAGVAGDVDGKRAKLIARTEVPGMLNAGHQIQGEEVEKEGFAIEKVWTTVGDRDVRESHAYMDGVRVPGAAGLFNLSGYEIPYPAHFSLPPEEKCNCLLPGQFVQGSFVAGTKAWYEGQVTEIITRGGRRLAVTPHHGVLTENGFVPASSIQEGDKLVAYNGQIETSSLNATDTNDVNDKPALIEDVFDSFRLRAEVAGSDWMIETAATQQTDFHGDGQGIQGQIEIVGPKRKLIERLKATCKKEPLHSALWFLNATLISEPGGRSANAAEMNGTVGRSDEGRSDVRGGSPRRRTLSLDKRSVLLDYLPFEPLGFGPAAYFDACICESAKENRAAGAQFVSELLERYAVPIPFGGGFDVDRDAAVPLGCHSVSDGDTMLAEMRCKHIDMDACLVLDRVQGHSCTVFLDEIVEIRNSTFRGHVYDLQSVNGIIITENICLSNCRCSHYTEALEAPALPPAIPAEEAPLPSELVSTTEICISTPGK